jgi:hypothetical protein
MFPGGFSLGLLPAKALKRPLTPKVFQWFHPRGAPRMYTSSPSYLRLEPTAKSPKALSMPLQRIEIIGRKGWIWRDFRLFAVRSD